MIICLNAVGRRGSRARVAGAATRIRSSPDGWQGYATLTSKGFGHRPRSQAKAKRDTDTDPVLPRAHRAISNVKGWLRGTRRGVSAEHLQVSLDEFICRNNRRLTPMAAFQTLLGLSSQHPPPTRAEIVAEGPTAAKTRLS